MGKLLQRVHNVHIKGDPLFGKFVDKLPGQIGLPSVQELGAGMGGRPADGTDYLSSEEVNPTIPEVEPMPVADDSKVSEARKRATALQRQQQGRASTILSDNSSDRLGG